MNQLFQIMILIACWSMNAHADRLPSIPYEIEFAFPTPGESPRGMAWDGTNLWIGDDGVDMIFSIDSSTGETLTSFPAPMDSISGLTWDGENICAVFQDDMNIYRFDPVSGEVRDTIPIVFEQSPNRKWPVWGLTWYDECYYFSVVAVFTYSSQILKYDTRTGETTFLNWDYSGDMTYANGYIYRIRPGSYTLPQKAYSIYESHLPFLGVDRILYSPLACITGLTWDGDTFWMCDDAEKNMYRLTIDNSVGVKKTIEPLSLIVGEPSPNPFNSQTIISFALERPGQVKVSVYDINGGLVCHLIDTSFEAGQHSISWNGKDSNDRRVSSGNYVCVFETPQAITARKMLHLK